MTSEVPAAVRPSRLWYLVAAVVPAGLLGAAPLTPGLLRGGDVGVPLSLNQPAPVSMSPPDERMVWAREGGTPPAEISCTFADDPRLAATSIERVLTGPVQIGADGVRWRGVLLLSARPAGSYRVTCVTSGAGASPTLSIGTPLRFTSPRARAVITLSTAGLAFAGVVMGALIAVVVAVRRHRSRSGS